MCLPLRDRAVAIIENLSLELYLLVRSPKCPIDPTTVPIARSPDLALAVPKLSHPFTSVTSQKRSCDTLPHQAHARFHQ